MRHVLLHSAMVLISVMTNDRHLFHYKVRQVLFQNDDKCYYTVRQALSHSATSVFPKSEKFYCKVQKIGLGI